MYRAILSDPDRAAAIREFRLQRAAECITVPCGFSTQTGYTCTLTDDVCGTHGAGDVSPRSG